jgi:uncharacterized protein YdhG (YjbR/CyaY superfamily)
LQKEPSFTTIDEYIQLFPGPIRKRLAALRRLIHETAPDAQERISYRMPTFFLNGNLVHFAAHSGHIGFYPTPSGISRFERELSRYVYAKGSVQFPLDEELPVELIKKIVKFRVDENRKRKNTVKRQE